MRIEGQSPKARSGQQTAFEGMNENYAEIEFIDESNWI
jgi:hypothetical protein